MARQSGGHARCVHEETGGAVPIASRLVAVVSCVVGLGAMIYGLQASHQLNTLAPGGTPPAFVVASPVPSLIPSPASHAVLFATPLPSISPSPAIPRIGIVAGHYGSDVGAMCPDGLTEVEITLDVAERVVYVLRALGYQADLLEEFDARLEGYRADALVSIHADSCEDFPNATPPASGFKVASVEDSMVPELERRLVACLAQCYAARTGMYFHATSITYDMTRYHAFYEIDGQTPAAIIEIGFMGKDRALLTQRPDLVARGIVDGLVCFIEGD